MMISKPGGGNMMDVPYLSATAAAVGAGRLRWLCLFVLLVVGSFPSSARGQDITTGLVGHWKLDEGSGTNASDSSGNGYSGTLTNGPTWTTGRINGTVDFDGANDYVVTAVSAPFQIAVRTVSAWIYPRTAGESNFGTIVSTHEAGPDFGWAITMCSNDGTECPATSNTIEIFNYFTGTDGAWYATTGVTLNAWNHVAVSYDASSTSNVPVIYINGQVMTLGGPTLGAPTGSSQHASGDVLRIGTYDTDALFSFDGLIDDVRFYNRILSAADVATLYAYTGSCSNPTGVTGKIVYNSDFNVMQYCNGTRWNAMGPVPGAGGAGCSNPARATGSWVYNTDFNVMQYCDGTNWQAMGPVPGAGGGGCSNPARATGSMVFNDDADVMQYCDGTNWIQIGS